MGPELKKASLGGRTDAVLISDLHGGSAAMDNAAASVLQSELAPKKIPHVSHNSGRNEWYTPSPFVEMARKAMGGIDCDPASSAVANRNVQAEIYYTAEQNGLVQTWFGRVWMNPPYSNPLCAQFCSAIVEKFLSGEIEQACVLVNNATETRWFQSMLANASSACFLSGRVKYLDCTGTPANSPLQGQAILYFGRDSEKFARAFSSCGRVVVPHGTQRIAEANV